MKTEHLEESLVGIRNLLSHLHSEVSTLEQVYFEVLQILQRVEGQLGRDEHTGLSRRGDFFRRWRELIGECARVGENHGLLMIDVDRFKQLNDGFGHLAGDEVLRRVAEVLRQFESPKIVAGRLGGEEFAVSVRGSDGEILSVAEMIRRAVEAIPNPTEGKWLPSVSIGLASAGKSTDDTQKLLAAADGAMYEAKRGGRNQVRIA